MEHYIVGPTLALRDGTLLDTRTIVTEHIKEDLNGAVPSPAEFLREMPISRWMGGFDKPHKRRIISQSLDGDASPPVVSEKIVWHDLQKYKPDLNGKHLTCSKEAPVQIVEWLDDGWVNPPGAITHWACLPMGPTES